MGKHQRGVAKSWPKVHLHLRIKKKKSASGGVRSERTDCFEEENQRSEEAHNNVGGGKPKLMEVGREGTTRWSSRDTSCPLKEASRRGRSSDGGTFATRGSGAI